MEATNLRVLREAYIRSIIEKVFYISRLADRYYREQGKGSLCMILNEQQNKVADFIYYPLRNTVFYDTRPRLKEAVIMSRQPDYILLTTVCHGPEPIDLLLKIHNPQVFSLFLLNIH